VRVGSRAQREGTYLRCARGRAAHDRRAEEHAVAAVRRPRPQIPLRTSGRAYQRSRDLRLPHQGEAAIMIAAALPRLAMLGALAGLLLCSCDAATAQDFYKDKKITLLVGTTAGGGYDTDGRLIAKYMARYIPGEPSIVVSNMPGASGVKAVNYLYSGAPKDGTVIGTFNSAMPFLEAAGAPGVQYKSTELSWIGNLSQSVQVVVVWHTAGVR